MFFRIFFFCLPCHVLDKTTSNLQYKWQKIFLWITIKSTHHPILLTGRSIFPRQQMQYHGVILSVQNKLLLLRYINTVARGRCGNYFKALILKRIIQRSSSGVCWEIALRWIPYQGISLMKSQHQLSEWLDHYRLSSTRMSGHIVIRSRYAMVYIGFSQGYNPTLCTADKHNQQSVSSECWYI